MTTHTDKTEMSQDLRDKLIEYLDETVHNSYEGWEDQIQQFGRRTVVRVIRKVCRDKDVSAEPPELIAEVKKDINRYIVCSTPKTAKHVYYGYLANGNSLWDLLDMLIDKDTIDDFMEDPYGNGQIVDPEAVTYWVESGQEVENDQMSIMYG